MGPFTQQVFSLLTTDPGNLVYQLVLAFSILAALQAAWSHMRLGDYPHARRLVGGLALLLVFRLALFAAGGLAWQGLLSPDVLLPPVDRAVNLLSLLVIVWMWVFPAPNRAADAASLLLGLLLLTMSVLGVVWWSSQGAGLSFNNSGFEVIALVTGSALAALGCLWLALRRPAAWPFGLAMLGLLLAGYLVQLLFPASEGSYSGALRLAQMAAYPFLLVLPQRFSIAAAAAAPAASAARSRIALQDLLALLALLDEANEDEVYHVLTASLATELQAAFCLWVLPFEDNGPVTLQCGYDRLHDAYLPAVTLENRRLPVIASALRHGHAQRLLANSTSPDLAGLAAALNLAQVGSILAVPILSPEGELLAGVILLAESARSWTEADQASLENLSLPLAQFLQHRQQSAAEQAELEQARQAAQAAQEQQELAQSERQKLVDQLTAMQQSANQDRSQLVSLAAVVASYSAGAASYSAGAAGKIGQPGELAAEVTPQQAAAAALITRLQAENDALKRAAAGGTPESEALAVEQMEGELRLTLQEIALLKAALGEADKKILSLKAMQSGVAASPQQVEAVISIAQELRQPLASILGYTDVLLGESIGLLGSLQRKFLERVRASSLRMENLVEDLLQAVAVEKGPAAARGGPVDLSGVIDEAIARTGAQLREKKIVLRVDLPEHLPRLNADAEALQRVLVQLLQNAGAVTPMGGDILLRARIEGSESKREPGTRQDYVMVQIADQGGGIPPAELPHLFSATAVEAGSSSNPRSAGALAPFLSGPSGSLPGYNGMGLATVKAFIDQLGGRIWVDNQPGYGATFSILLPVSSGQELNNGHKGAGV